MITVHTPQYSSKLEIIWKANNPFYVFIIFFEQSEGLAAIREKFPFTRYFSNAPQPIFKGNCFDEDWDIAEVSSTDVILVLL